MLEPRNFVQVVVPWFVEAFLMHKDELLQWCVTLPVNNMNGCRTDPEKPSNNGRFSTGGDGRVKRKFAVFVRDVGDARTFGQQKIHYFVRSMHTGKMKRGVTAMILQRNERRVDFVQIV